MLRYLFAVFAIIIAFTLPLTSNALQSPVNAQHADCLQYIKDNPDFAQLLHDAFNVTAPGPDEYYANMEALMAYMLQTPLPECFAYLEDYYLSFAVKTWFIYEMTSRHLVGTAMQDGQKVLLFDGRPAPGNFRALIQDGVDEFYIFKAYFCEDIGIDCSDTERVTYIPFLETAGLINAP